MERQRSGETNFSADKSFPWNYSVLKREFRESKIFSISLHPTRLENTSMRAKFIGVFER